MNKKQEAYQKRAEQCRAALLETSASDLERRRKLKHIAKAYETLAKLTEPERLAIFDTGAYKKTLSGYIKRSLDSAGVSEDIKRRVMNSFTFSLDIVKAEEAERYDKYN